jgi:hypothetical protein
LPQQVAIQQFSNGSHFSTLPDSIRHYSWPPMNADSDESNIRLPGYFVDATLAGGFCLICIEPKQVRLPDDDRGQRADLRFSFREPFVNRVVGLFLSRLEGALLHAGGRRGCGDG